MTPELWTRCLRCLGRGLTPLYAVCPACSGTGQRRVPFDEAKRKAVKYLRRVFAPALSEDELESTAEGTLLAALGEDTE